MGVLEPFRAGLFATAVAWALLVLSASGQPSSAAPAPYGRPSSSAETLRSRGERLYRQGSDADGRNALAATVQGDLHVRSTAMPCVNCHRRSGWGTAEGPVTVPPIVGAVLFAPLAAGAPQFGVKRRGTGVGSRAAYTDAALAKTLRDGADPSGRMLSLTMPRYDVSERDAAALGAYLRSLSAQPPPGVTESAIHLATIVTPTVSAARRASMLDVLRTYVRFKNAGTRYETRRREHGPWDMKQQYSVYRDWVLHEWELHGAPREWPAQLEELYQREPVFAIVGGIADEDWSPIHDFSARHGIPVLLPQTPLAPTASAGDGFYSLYFSGGVALEAQALAHHFSTAASGRRVLQVSRCGGAGASGAAALASSLRSMPVRSECLPRAAALTGSTWRALLGDADTLVLWLDAADATALETLAAEPAVVAHVKEVFLSSSLMGDEMPRVPAPLVERTALADPFVPPDEFEQHALRSLMWFKANHLTPPDRQVAVNALFAASLVADALNLPRTLSSREYFIERLEHMASRSLTPSAYPSVTFDAKRRFASAGCHVLKVPSTPGGPFTKVQEWFVPKL